MTPVYVVMGNDYPERVYDTEAAAEEFCKQQGKERKFGEPKIYWRVYSFTLLTETDHE